MEVHEPFLLYAKPYYTIDEYLAMEDASTVKHEYFKGEIFDMQGDRRPQIDIKSNLSGLLHEKLNSEKCSLYFIELRHLSVSNTLLNYPDICIVDGEPEIKVQDKMCLLNPSVVIQISSSKSAGDEVEAKLEFIKDIPSVREYVLVDSGRMSVKCYLKDQDGKWLPTIYTQANEELLIQSIDIRIPMPSLYYKFDLIDRK